MEDILLAQMILAQFLVLAMLFVPLVVTQPIQAHLARIDLCQKSSLGICLLVCQGLPKKRLIGALQSVKDAQN